MLLQSLAASTSSPYLSLNGSLICTQEEVQNLSSHEEQLLAPNLSYGLPLSKGTGLFIVHIPGRLWALEFFFFFVQSNIFSHAVVTYYC